MAKHTVAFLFALALAVGSFALRVNAAPATPATDSHAAKPAEVVAPKKDAAPADPKAPAVQSKQEKPAHEDKHQVGKAASDDEEDADADAEGDDAGMEDNVKGL